MTMMNHNQVPPSTKAKDRGTTSLSETGKVTAFPVAKSDIDRVTPKRDAYVVVNTDLADDRTDDYCISPRQLRALALAKRQLPDVRTLLSDSMNSMGLFTDKPYRTYINASFDVTTNGSGVILSSIGTGLYGSSSAPLYKESVDLTALFDEYRVLSTQLEVTGTLNPAVTTNTPGAIIFGFNSNSFDGDAAVSYDGTLRLPLRHQIQGCTQVSTFKVKAKVPYSKRPFANITQYNTGGTPDGSSGAWWVVNGSTLAEGKQYCVVAIRNLVELRRRV